MKSCLRCLYNEDHPFGIFIDEYGICSGCRVHEEKDTLEWPERWKKLVQITNEYKSTTGTYDCIVPVTGAGDSYYILDIVKNKLGLNPLLVNYNKYYNTQIAIKNLANLRIKFDCDMIGLNVNPVSVKKITRKTLRDYGNINWHCIAGQTVFPVQTAIRYRIPLIIWGAHQGLEQTGMYSHLHEVEMTRRYRADIDLFGVEAEALISDFDTINEDDIINYVYPSDSDIRSVGVRGIYLGNYVRWDPRTQHESMISKYGYIASKLTRTFDTYDNVDCWNYTDLHDYLKFIKLGYSKVTDHACRELRFGRLSRENALKLVESYQSKSPRYVDKFCSWLGVDVESVKFILDRYKVYTLERNVGSVQTEQPKGYLHQYESLLDAGSDYITVGRGL